MSDLKRRFQVKQDIITGLTRLLREVSEVDPSSMGVSEACLLAEATTELPIEISREGEHVPFVGFTRFALVTLSSGLPTVKVMLREWEDIIQVDAFDGDGTWLENLGSMYYPSGIGTREDDVCLIVGKILRHLTDTVEVASPESDEDRRGRLHVALHMLFKEHGHDDMEFMFEVVKEDLGLDQEGPESEVAAS